MHQTICFIHGFLGAPHDWDEVRSELPEYHVVAPQVPLAADWEEGIEQMLDMLPPYALWVGYSMGARLALGMACRSPERCKALVFVSGNPGLEDGERQLRRQIDEQLASRLEVESPVDFLNWWYRQPVFQSLSHEMMVAEIQAKQSRIPGDWPEILRRYSVSRQPNYWDALDRLTMPILAVAGEHDTKYSRMVTQMLRRRSTEGAIIPEAGHLVHRQQPHVFVQLLRTFFTSDSIHRS